MIFTSPSHFVVDEHKIHLENRLSYCDNNLKCICFKNSKFYIQLSNMVLSFYVFLLTDIARERDPFAKHSNVAHDSRHSQLHLFFFGRLHFHCSYTYVFFTGFSFRTQGKIQSFEE